MALSYYMRRVRTTIETLEVFSSMSIPDERYSKSDGAYAATETSRKVEVYAPFEKLDGLSVELLKLSLRHDDE